MPSSGELQWELRVVPGLGNVRSPRQGAGDGHCPFAEQGLGALRRRAVCAGQPGTVREAGRAREPEPNISTGAGTAWEGAQPGGTCKAPLLQSSPCDSEAAAGIFGA